MKKIICYLASLFILWQSLCNSATAGQPQPISQTSLLPFSNQWRLGLGLAGEYMNSDANLTIEATPTLGGNMYTTQSQIGKLFQLAPCVELGKTITDHYYLGLLLSWRYSDLKSASRSPILGSYYFLHEFKFNQYGDILIKAGYKFTPRIMGYGLIGPSIANWTHTSNQIDGNQMTLLNKLQINKTTLGLGLGLGFEYLFQEKHAFSIDYTHHFHSSISKRQAVSFPVVNGAGAIVPRTGEMNKKIGLSYATIAVRYTMFFQL